MPLFTRHPLALQTAYSDLKRRALDQETILVGTPGTVSVREVGGGRFYYRQFYDAQGRKSAQYIGAVGVQDAEERARANREAISIAGALVADARMLARQGYARVDARTGAILAAVARRGLFRAGAVLVGSHAYGALLAELGVAGAGFATEDVDVARAAPLRLTLPPDVDFAGVLAESTVRLAAVPGLDRKAPPVAFKVVGGRLHVDLLVPAAGSEVGVRAVPELRAHATAVPFLAYLLREPVPSVVLGREGVIPVAVPRPEVFAWHKMLVSHCGRRPRTRKDVMQAAVVFAVLSEDAPDALQGAFDALPRGTRTKTRAGARAVLAMLERGGHQRAAEVMAGYV